MRTRAVQPVSLVRRQGYDSSSCSGGAALVSIRAGSHTLGQCIGMRTLQSHESIHTKHVNWGGL